MASDRAHEPTVVVEGVGEAAVAAAAEVWAEATAARDHHPIPAVDVARAVLDAVLAAPGGTLLLAVSGTTVVGFATIAATDEAGEVEVHHLGVRPDARGRGVGSSMLAAVAARLERGPSTRARLSVYVDNTAARRLYERRGWLPQGTPTPHPRSGRLEQRYVLRMPG